MVEMRWVMVRADEGKVTKKEVYVNEDMDEYGWRILSINKNTPRKEIRIWQETYYGRASHLILSHHTGFNVS